MNLGFIDINAMVSTQQNSGIPKGVSTDREQGADQGFADTLSQAQGQLAAKDRPLTAKSGQGQKPVSDNNAGGQAGTQETAQASAQTGKQKAVQAGAQAGGQDAVHGIDLSGGDQEGRAVRFLSGLTQFFLEMSKGNLKSVTMDAEGLDALQKLLLKAGFDSADVQDVISGLKEKAEAGAVSLETIIQDLSDIMPDMAGQAEEDTLIDTSALPFISVLLEDLGIPGETVQKIVAAADQGQEGISLDVLVQEMKQIQAQMDRPDASLAVKTDHPALKAIFEQLNRPDASSANNADSAAFKAGVKPLNVKPLNLDMNRSTDNGAAIQTDGSPEILADDGSMTLDELISAFEGLKNKTSAKHSGTNLAQGSPAKTNVMPSSAVGAEGTQGPGEMVKESTGTLIDQLVQALNLADKEATVSEFSFQGIRDQFKNDLLIPGKKKSGKTGSNTQNPLAGEVKALEGNPRGVEAILTNGKGGDAREKNQDRVFSDPKSDQVRTGEMNHGAGASAKADNAETLVNTLKAKPTARPLPSYVTYQVEKSIVRAINQGETSLKLQLKPAELGRLTMTIDNVGNSMKVSIIAENQAARDILTANVHELKTALGHAGISLDSFDVDMNSDFRQSMADARGQAKNSGQGNGGRGKEGFDGPMADGTDGSSGGGASQILDNTYHFVA